MDEVKGVALSSRLDDGQEKDDGANTESDGGKEVGCRSVTWFAKHVCSAASPRRQKRRGVRREMCD